METRSPCRRVLTLFFVAFVSFVVRLPAAAAGLRAGAYAQDVTPTVFPVIVNGNFAEVVANKASDALFARAIVLEDGKERVAIVVVDSCMMPRELLDDAKARANKLTGIAVDRMMISATHAHSAPAAMGCLGSDADANYVKGLPELIARAVERANANLAPAAIGAAVVQDAEHTFCRRWVFRADRVRKDPFGELTVRANMHPGYQLPDAIGPSGPVDPGLSVVAIRRVADGRPLALLANYSMHYVGAGAVPVSADYYGRFAAKIGKLIGAEEGFVGVMSQGTSGDLWLGDYAKAKPAKMPDIEMYSDAIAAEVAAAVKTIKYVEDAPVVMRESTITLKRRVPDERRLAWARATVAAMKDAKPRAQPDIYAREAVMLHEEPERELKLQALRVGEIGIAAWPNEVFALSGLKVKAMSPLAVTINVELANGAEGYIPPPEQHVLGGYTTWPARTAALEAGAEPRIVEGVVKLLEAVSGQRRRAVTYAEGPFATAVLASKPAAYFRMAEMSGGAAVDSSGNAQSAAYEPGVVFYLPGPESAAFNGDAGGSSRAAHFAGGRMTTELAQPGKPYTVEFCVWNGLAATARPVTAYLFSRGPAGDKLAPGDHLGIGGNFEGGANAGKLIFYNGNARDTLLAGKTPLAQRGWYHVALVRDGRGVRAYLNGRLEIEGEADVTSDAASAFFGGRCDGFANLEGKLCEAAVYGRALAGEEIAAHAKAAALPAPPPVAVAPVVAVDVPQAAISNSQAAIRAQRPPRAPEETLKSIHVPPGMVIELVASEPLIASPVAIDWGADGKLWVVEMIDYPYGMDGRGKPGGRIKYLESTKNDGHYDKATTFMEDVRMPNGIIAWGKGVIVTAAPEIFYAEDTDGDGKADKREVLFRGFKEGNPQLRVNGLRWGLDNWLYVANGWSAGVAESVKTGQKLDLKGRDLRIRPDTGEMELVSGVSQFGRERDDWGRWFGVDNAHPLFHYVLDDHYARRNPHVAFGDGKVQLLPLPLPPVFPRSPFTKRYIGLDHHGHYTSACGINVYRDELVWKNGTEGTEGTHVLICEPVHNLVQHQVLTEAGTTFTANRVDGEPNTDFIAGEDPWFRPVMTRTGPDGAVYVVDMYRFMIEHPDWLNPEGKAALAPFYRDGEGRGRIYRVYPKDKRPREIPRLDTASADQLVATLESPSGHTRDLAHRLIVRGDDPAFVPLLEKLFAASKDPHARLHALCALDGLRGGSLLRGEVIAAAVKDASPGVRTQAVRLAERRFAGDPAMLAAVVPLAADADEFVAQQVAYALGESDRPEAGAALAALANRWMLGDRLDQSFPAPPERPHLTAAVMSSAARHFKALVATRPQATSNLWPPLMNMAVAAHDRAAIAELLGPAPQAGATIDAREHRRIARFLDVLAAHDTSIAKLSGTPDALADRLRQLDAVFDSARGAVAQVAEAERQEREFLAATALLGRQPAHRADDLKVIDDLFDLTVPTDVQLEAIRAAARTGDARVPDMILDNRWWAKTPTVQAAAVDVLMSREDWALALVKFKPNLDFARKQRLLNHPSAKVKAAARASLAQGAVNADRQKVIDGYAAALTLAGDAGHGQALYAANCATCHKVGSLAGGHEMGPNLLTVREWPKENLLAAVLDPDRTVEPRYVAYTATLADGTALTGLLTAESAGSVTIKTLDDVEHAVPRSTLKALASTGRSLMPAGFEAAMTAQDLADLFAFLATPVAPR